MKLRIVEILALISELNQHVNVICRNMAHHVAVILSNLLLNASSMRDRQVQRRKLSRLTDDQLKDVGVTREQAQSESKKLFWQ